MKAKDTQAIADDAQKDLNEALPALVSLFGKWTIHSLSALVNSFTSKYFKRSLKIHFFNVNIRKIHHLKLEFKWSLLCLLKDAALASLKTLNKNDIVEVRALQRPPDGVKMVIDAVCIMKNAKPKKILDEKVCFVVIIVVVVVVVVSIIINLINSKILIT